MTSTRTRLLAALTAAILLLGAGACGSDDKKDAKPSSSTSTSDSGATPSGDATGDTDSSSDTPPTTLTKANFLSTIISAVESKQSAHMVMTFGTSLKADADVRFGKGGNASAMRMDMQIGGQDLKAISIGSTVYVQQGAGQKYVKVTKSTPGLGQILDQLGNIGPSSALNAMRSGVQSVKYVGPDTVDGAKVAKYAVSVDTAKLVTALGAAGQAQGQNLPKSVTYDMYVDADNLPRRFVISISGQQITTTMSKWGEPVDIQAPPPSQVATQQ